MRLMVLLMLLQVSKPVEQAILESKSWPHHRDHVKNILNNRIQLHGVEITSHHHRPFRTAYKHFNIAAAKKYILKFFLKIKTTFVKIKHTPYNK